MEECYHIWFYSVDGSFVRSIANTQNEQQNYAMELNSY